MKKKSKVKEKEISQNLEKLDEVIKEKRKKTLEQHNKVGGNVFRNLILAAISMAFFIFLIIGAQNIDTNIFAMYLKIFTLVAAFATVLLYEISYKKDSGYICIHGIECMFFAVVMMSEIYIFKSYYENYTFINAIIIFIFAIYYVIKATILYFKSRKSYVKSQNDINEIIKK